MLRTTCAKKKIVYIQYFFVKHVHLSKQLNINMWKVIALYNTHTFCP